MEFQIFEMLFFVLSMWFNARFCFVLELDRFCFMQISYSDLKINHEKSEIQFSIICFSFDWWLESERWCQLKYRVIDIKISEIGVADSKQKTLRSADLEKKMELKKKRKKKAIYVGSNLGLLGFETRAKPPDYENYLLQLRK